MNLGDLDVIALFEKKSAKKLGGEKVADVGIAGVWYNAANIDEQKDKNIFYMG